MSERKTEPKESISEAVVIVKGKKIVLFNGAAVEIFPNIGTMKPEELFTPYLLSKAADGFAGEAELAGVLVFVSVSTGADSRIYTIRVQRESNRMLNLLSASCAEYRNVLSVLKMASGLLLPYVEDSGNPKADKYAAMVYHSYYSMLRLTNNLYEYGAILRNEYVLKKTVFDLVAACHELVDSVRHLVSGSGLNVDFSSSEESLVICADREKIEKMLLNLLSNSIAKTPAGGNVLLSVVSAGERVVMTVMDNGSGIPSDMMAAVWNRYLSPKKPGSDKSGIGLGLTIVQTIAQMHGGSAVLETKWGEGTTVTVSILLEKPDTSDFKSGVSVYESSDMQPLLVELSDVLTYDKYTQLYMD